MHMITPDIFSPYTVWRICITAGMDYNQGHTKEP